MYENLKQKKFIRSYGGPPPQVLVDASHADRASDIDDICFFILIVVFAIIMSGVAIGIVDFPGKWEAFVFPWGTVAFYSGGLWRGKYASKHEFDCGYCVYRRCNERGKFRKLFYCDKWTTKPIMFFDQILLTGYSVFVTLILLFTNEVWSMVLMIIIMIIFWSIAIVMWGLTINDYFKLDPTPRAYLTPPSHPITCICHGTGICPWCGGKGKVKIGTQTNICSIVCPEEPGITKEGHQFVCCIMCIIMLIGYAIAAAILWAPFY